MSRICSRLENDTGPGSEGCAKTKRPRVEPPSVQSPHSFLNSGGVAPAIQHGRHSGNLPDNLVVDGKWETFGKKAVMTEVPRVNARIKPEGVNVGKQGIEEIIAEAHRLRFVEAIAFDQVPFDFVKNLDLHRVRSRILRLASVQST